MPWRGPEEAGEYPTLGWVALDWIEDNLLIPDGPRMGQPFRFYDEQAEHLLNRYRLDPNATEEDANEAYTWSGSMWVRGQKWGKDPAMAAIDLFHAFGPCDFAGWDADGNPVGRPNPSPWIAIAALNDKQTINTWAPLKAMLEASDLADLPGVDINLDGVRLPGGNVIENLTTTAFGRLGGRFTHVSLTENGLMTATGAERQNTGKRSPLAFARTLIRSVSGMGGMWIGATNPWDPTEDSHAQQVYEAYLSGKGTAYVDAKLARKHCDLSNVDELREELRYLYGDSAKEAGGHVGLARLVRDVQDPSSGEVDVRRFFLGEVLAGVRPLADTERWAKLEMTDDPLRAGEAITLGFDGSRSLDCTVLTACRVRDGRLFHLRTWKPSEHAKHRVPRKEVDQAVRDAFAGYEVWYLFADPYKWQDYLDVWSALYPNRVVEQPTNVEVRMDEMLERFDTALRNGELTHDGDDTLTTHVRNAVVVKGRRKPSKPRVDADGVLVEHYLKVVKKRDEPGLHIDAAVSALLAYDARGRALEDGATTKTEPPAPVGIPSSDHRATSTSIDYLTTGF